MINPARTVPANSVGSFIAFGLLAALPISLILLLVGPLAGIWNFLIPNLIFHCLIGIAIYRCRALATPQIVLFVAALVVVSAFLSKFAYQTVMPQLFAHHVQPQVVGQILGRLAWVNGGLIALATIAFFRGRSPIALVAAIMPGPVTAGIIAFATIAPQMVGFGLPGMKALGVVSILAAQTIHAIALWVVATNGNRPVGRGFVSMTLKRPPDLHWLWVLALSAFSGGGFVLLWGIVQGCWAKGAGGSARALAAYLTSTAIMVFVAGMITALPFLETRGLHDALVRIMLALLAVGMAAYWIGAFATATAVETYAKTGQFRDLRLNRLWVFLVPLPYLQFHLSRLAADDPQENSVGAVFA